MTSERVRDFVRLLLKAHENQAECIPTSSFVALFAGEGLVSDGLAVSPLYDLRHPCGLLVRHAAQPCCVGFLGTQLTLPADMQAVYKITGAESEYAAVLLHFVEPHPELRHCGVVTHLTSLILEPHRVSLWHDRGETVLQLAGRVMNVFPRSDLDRPGELLHLLGTFWSSFYAGRDLVRGYATTTGRVAAEVQERVTESLDNLSRDTVRVLGNRTYVPAVIRRSSRHLLRPVRFGDGRLFGDGLVYGLRLGEEGYTLSAESVRSIALITDQLLRPSHSLVSGLDFTITPTTGTEAASLAFRVDPFTQGDWPTRPVIEYGEVVDEELTLWLYDVLIDRDAIWKNFGSVLGLRMRSSEGYKRLVAALLDAVSCGTSTLGLRRVLGSLTGVPLASGNEVVEDVFVDRRGRTVVVTDAASYDCGFSAAVVAAGDAVSTGDVLCDSLTVHEVSGSPLPSWASTLVLGEGYLLDAFGGELAFSNRDLPLVVGQGEQGRTAVSCQLGGDPEAIERFWDEVHRRGVATGQTLAHLLDRRPNPVGEPTAANLPATLNPCRLLTENIFRGRTLLVRVRGALSGEAIGTGTLPFLRRIVPPGTALFFFVDMPTLSEEAPLAACSEMIGHYEPMKTLWGAVVPGDDWINSRIYPHAEDCHSRLSTIGGASETREMRRPFTASLCG